MQEKHTKHQRPHGWRAHTRCQPRVRANTRCQPHRTAWHTHTRLHTPTQHASADKAVPTIAPHKWGRCCPLTEFRMLSSCVSADMVAAESGWGPLPVQFFPVQVETPGRAGGRFLRERPPSHLCPYPLDPCNQTPTRPSYTAA